MRTVCIEICFEWLSSMDQATKLELVVEMLQLRRLLDKTVAAQRQTGCTRSVNDTPPKADTAHATSIDTFVHATQEVSTCPPAAPDRTVTAHRRQTRH